MVTLSRVVKSRCANASIQSNLTPLLVCCRGLCIGATLSVTRGTTELTVRNLLGYETIVSDPLLHKRSWHDQVNYRSRPVDQRVNLKLFALHNMRPLHEALSRLLLSLASVGVCSVRSLSLRSTPVPITLISFDCLRPTTLYSILPKPLVAGVSSIKLYATHKRADVLSHVDVFRDHALLIRRTDTDAH